MADRTPTDLSKINMSTSTPAKTTTRQPTDLSKYQGTRGSAPKKKAGRSSGRT